MNTKRAVVTRLIQEFFDWSVDEKLVARADLAKMLKTYSVTPEKVVAYIEQFCFAPYEAGVLPAYIGKEVSKGRFMLLKFGNMAKDASLKTSMQQYSKRTVTPKQLQECVRQLTTIVEVLKLVPANKRAKK